MLLPEKRRESDKMAKPQVIEICSYCELDRPVFEQCQTLLHPELTPWWSFLLADGAHHKKPHSPPTPLCIMRLKQCWLIIRWTLCKNYNLKLDIKLFKVDNIKILLRLSWSQWIEDSLKTESCLDANFVITDNTVITNLGFSAISCRSEMSSSTLSELFATDDRPTNSTAVMKAKQRSGFNS